MRGKFAIYMCRETGCVKIGLGKKTKCPTHGKRMVRTIVMTERYVKDHNLLGKQFDEMVEGIRGSFKL